MSFEPPAPMTKITLQAADGTEFAFVIDVDPDIVWKQWNDIGVEEGKHGLMLLRDRRSDEAERGVHWQVWTSSVRSFGATDSEEPIPLPPQTAD
jgi:hypothetical protein